MVGLNWHVQCLSRLGAVEEQLVKLVELDADFLARLEPPGEKANLAWAILRASGV